MFLHSLLARLCLALVLLTGVHPGQGLVLCIEADGCVRWELRTDDSAARADCMPCDDHVGDTEGAELPLDTSAEDEADPCACVDLTLPAAAKEQRGVARAQDAPAIAWPALATIEAPRPLVATFRGDAGDAFEPSNSETTRARLRGVVLLV